MAVVRDSAAAHPALVAPRLQQARANLVAPAASRCHLPEPDYGRPLLQIPESQRKNILDKLTILYGGERALACHGELERRMRVYYAHKTLEMIADDASFEAAERFGEKDVILITYGDLLTSPGKKPLEALSDFLRIFMRGAINTVHILPFFPYSSDRGFSIVDFEEVDSRLGAWEDLEELSLSFRLMYDGVFNHVSSKSRWFQGFLNGDPDYQDFFTAFSTKDAIDKDHLRLILRPRTSDLLTPFQTIDGPRFVWTTFSPDQVDLNYKNEKVLLRILEILLDYVRRGADVIRLDAVTYIWRELGTRNPGPTGCTVLGNGSAGSAILCSGDRQASAATGRPARKRRSLCPLMISVTRVTARSGFSWKTPKAPRNEVRPRFVGSKVKEKRGARSPRAGTGYE
jgi:hypothetical protein